MASLISRSFGSYQPSTALFSWFSRITYLFINLTHINQATGIVFRIQYTILRPSPSSPLITIAAYFFHRKGTSVRYFLIQGSTSVINTVRFFPSWMARPSKFHCNSDSDQHPTSHYIINSFLSRQDKVMKWEYVYNLLVDDIVPSQIRILKSSIYQSYTQ